MRKILPVALLCFFTSATSSAQIGIRETFETVSGGAGRPLSFTRSGTTFDIITAATGVNAGGLFGVYIPGNSYTMPGGGQVVDGDSSRGVGVSCGLDNCSGDSHNFIDNGPSNGLNQTYAIKTSNGFLFTPQSIYLYLSADNGSSPSAAGTISIKGKKAGVVLYTYTKSTGFRTDLSFNNGFNFISFRTSMDIDRSFTPVDEIEFTLSGSFNYFAIDNFTFRNFHNWVGGTGNWNTAGNWDRGTVPDLSANVNISSGKPAITDSVECRELHINNSAVFEPSASVKTYSSIFNHATMVSAFPIYPGDNVYNFAGANFTGTGSVAIFHFENAGTFNIGNPISNFSMPIALFVPRTSGKMVFDLGGTAPGQYDQLTLGSETLDGGTLEIRLANGFVPSVGQTFTLINFTGAVSGVYGDVIWPAGVTGSVTYNAQSIVINILSVLPVKLESFTGNNLGRSNQLNWKTSAEVNIGKYELLWSRDGINFSTINSQPAKGNSGTNNYSFTHANASRVNYYRLKISDVDGKSTMSDVLKFENGTPLSVNIYPNPATDKIQIDLKENAVATVQFINSLGQTVKTFKSTSLNNTIDVKELPAGVYSVRIEQGGLIKIQQFILCN